METLQILGRKPFDVIADLKAWELPFKVHVGDDYYREIATEKDRKQILRDVRRIALKQRRRTPGFKGVTR